MSFVMTDAVKQLRRRLGNPLTFEISDNDLTDAINSALKEYSKFRPRRKVEDLNLVKGQELYDLPSGVIGVVDCILSFRGDTDRHYYGSPEFPMNHYPYNHERTDGSLRMIKELQDEKRNDLFNGYEWEYDAVGNQIRVFPASDYTVTTSMTLAYMVSETNFPDRDFELMFKYARAEAMETLGNFRTKVKEIPTGVGYKMTLDGGEKLLERAPILREEFYEEIKSGGTWVVSG